MAISNLFTLLSTIALGLAAYACVAHAVFAARTQNALHELRGKLLLAQAKAPNAALAAVETRVTELQNECAADRQALAKVADRVHRLAGRLQGLQRAEALNADPEPGDRETLRSQLLKGHHATGAGGSGNG